MGLIGEVLCHTSFEDTARLREILLQEKSEWDMSVFSRGSSLVMTRLSSYFSKAGAFAEQLGLSYYYFLSDLVRDFDANSDEIVRRLAEVAKIIFAKSNLFIETIESPAR